MKLRVEFLNGDVAHLENVKKFKPMPEDKPMNFSEAVKAMKIGNKVRRIGWSSDISICTYEAPGYHWIKWNDSTKAWNPSTEDLEASDWWVML